MLSTFGRNYVSGDGEIWWRDTQSEPPCQGEESDLVVISLHPAGPGLDTE